MRTFSEEKEYPLKVTFKTCSSPPFHPHSEIIKFPVSLAKKKKMRKGKFHPDLGE